MVRTLAIDPGDSHVGIAEFEDAELQYADETTGPNLMARIIDGPDVDAIVIEEWRLYGWKAQALHGAKMSTSELIGSVKAIAAMRNIPVYEQQTVVKSVAAKSPWWKRIELKYGKIKNKHARDAALHGLYFTSFKCGLRVDQWR